MISVFHGKNEKEHDSFQAWRKANMDGFHMTESAPGTFVIHYTQDKRENLEGRGCIHNGGSDNRYLEDHCYTTARKVCSNIFKELITWAGDNGFATKNCKHCDSKRFPFPAMSLEIKGDLPEKEARLTGQDADDEGLSDNASYVPQEGDRRQLVERQIRERRGQQSFRDALRKRYGNRCLVTGCEILAVLEAAHINPYRGEDDNHPENGLLLRSDIHTLFDLDLLAIEPEHLRIELHPELVLEYGCFSHVSLGCDGHQTPSLEALSLRYERFRQRLDKPA